MYLAKVGVNASLSRAHSSPSRSVHQPAGYPAGWAPVKVRRAGGRARVSFKRRSSALKCSRSMHTRDPLSNDQLATIRVELVARHFQVQRGWALTDTARGVVVRSVARAEVATEVTGTIDGHAPEVGADAKHDQPLRVLHAFGIGLRGIKENVVRVLQRRPCFPQMAFHQHRVWVL